MKKGLIALLCALSFAVTGCSTAGNTNTPSSTTPSTIVPSTTIPSTTIPSTTIPSTTVPSTPITTTITTPAPVGTPGYQYLNSMSEEIKANFGAKGFVEGKIGDFSQYEGTEAYRKVTTANELLDAIVDAKYDYTNTWVFDSRNENEEALVARLTELEEKRSAGTITKDENTERVNIENQLKSLGVPGHVEQELKSAGTVHVIEIMNDLDMGYKTLQSLNCDLSVVDDFTKNKDSIMQNVNMSDMFNTHGISQIKIEQTSNLMIFSKNGAKLTHCGIKLTSDDNIVVRNLEFDELWQWEDSASATPNVKIGDYDAFGWAYFKISNCGYVWIDHCTFGKSYDGQIDYSHPTYAINKSVCFRAPYGADGGSGLHISNCRFTAGSDDKDGYLYKMMAKIEEDYQNGGNNYLYYNTLRDEYNLSFEDILYGIAIPQKKGFLLGDSGDDYTYNLEIKVSMANNVFINLQDRLPKIRGGIAYLYNNVVDSTQFYDYKIKLTEAGVKDIGSINSQYKCALVSQGIVCGLGGSVRAENTIYRGIQEILKNNDKANSEAGVTGTMVYGGYSMHNVSVQKAPTDAPYVGSMDNGASNNYYKYCTSPVSLTAKNFSWHNDDNVQPFTPAVYDLDVLEDTLNNICPVGVNKEIGDMYLYTNFEDYIPE